MKYLILILFIFPFFSFSQLNGTLSTDVYACTGTSGQTITFTGSNGTAPYTFFYNITGGSTQTVSTVSGNSVSLNVPTGTAGTFNYNLTQVDDNLGASASVSDQAVATIYALPSVSAGPDQSICNGSQVTLTGSGANTYSWTNGVFNASPFYPASTMTYTVTGVSAQGCVNTDQVIVFVNSVPIVGAGSDQSICSGASVTLSGSGASTYTWNNGVTNGVAFVPTSTQTYTVTGTTMGCVGTDQVTVTVNSIPVVSAGVDQSVCSGASVTLSGSGASTYTWNTGITNGVSFVPPATGTYTVTGTSAAGCTNYDQVLVTVNSLPNVSAGPDQSICTGYSTVLTGSGAMTYNWSPATGLSSTTTSSPNASPASTVTYTLTGVSSQGCVNTDQVVVFVGPTLNVNAGPDLVVCYADFFTLTATGGTTYTWDNGITNGVSNQALIPGTTVYTVTSTAGAGCSGSNQVVVYVDMPPNISAGSDITICEGTQTVLTGSGGITYIWDQGVIDGTPFTPSLGTTIYAVTGYSPAGCFGSDAVAITVVAPPTDPGAVIDSAGCNNGAIQIIQSAQTVNYSYNWMTGAITSGISNLAAGPYDVVIYDNSTGCYSSFTYDVPQSLISQNCAELSGFVYFDTDENCLINAGDSPQSNRMIVANPGNYLALTDQNGFYSMNLPLGTYTVQEIFNNPNYGNYCNLTYTVPLINSTDSIGGNNFLDTLLGDIDFQANMYNTSIMPGFGFMAYPVFYSLTSNGSLNNTEAWINIPTGVTLQSWNYPHTVSNDTIYFNLNTTSSFSSSISFLADVSLPLGSQVTFCGGVEIYPGELITANNTACLTTIVTGSFDPNDKTMFLNGVQSDSTIYLTDQTLDYLIRFQNTGTAPAQDIYILDTISSTLDLNSFEYVTASHNCIVSVLEDNVLKFNFPQIFLPDSTNNEPESHGFIHYRIRQSNQNTLGTVINNTAYIYFDFNSPVITNTTYDQIVIDDLGIEEGNLMQVKLYPNPTNGKITIESDRLIESLVILNSRGEIFNELEIDGTSSALDLSNLAKGVYFIQLKSSEGLVTKRLIIQ